MHHTHERRLISNLDPFHMLMHFFQKYAKIFPNNQDLIDILGDEKSEVKSDLIYVRPFDKKIRNVRIQADQHDETKPHSLQIRFPKEAISLINCCQKYCGYTLRFDAENMVSIFSFDQIRAVYLKSIDFHVSGKFTETQEGNFLFINPITYDRKPLERESISFKNFTLVFRNPAAGLY